MPLPLYLAITEPEISTANTLPEHLAYMACHFSSSNAGLSNFPQSLPRGSMLILNDSTPAEGHDPAMIAKQAADLCQLWGCSRLLLDFQRPFNELTFQITNAVIKSSCPVIVSEGYAKELGCPVFLSSLPADRPLKEWLAPWADREIWLEVALDAKFITIDKSGYHQSFTSLCDPTLLPHQSEALHCHYKIEIESEQVHFTLQRTGEDLQKLLSEAETLGVTGVVGLYQELDSFFHC